jgi:SAM-dependent methyltransferase
MDKVRLNLGSGPTSIEGWTNIDRLTGGDVYPLSDYADNSVDEIRASHILEHFSHRETVAVVREWARVLKPGGTIKIAVPNFDWVIAAYNSDKASEIPVESYLFGGHVDYNDRHGAMFNEEKLRAVLKVAGLSSIRPWKSDIADCASLQVSLNLEATKRLPVTKLEGVHGIMSAPRLAFTDQVTAMLETIHKLRIPIQVRQGVFWGQTLTAAMNNAIAEGAEYILTLDYDTIFTPDDVVELYQLIRDHPEADAIFAAQIGRDRNSLLLTIREDESKNRSQLSRDELQADLLPAATGHFGLSIFRVSTLKMLPNPWFIHQPDSNGGWGDGRVDEDIYFWRLLEKHGRRAFMANHVVIGHMQLMVTWPSKDLEPIHQYIVDYRKEGRPEGVLS